MEMPTKLPSRSKKCFSTQKNFAPGDAYASQLIWEGEQWERRDFSMEAWKSVEEKGEHWFGTLPEKEEKKKDTSLLALFKRRHAQDPLSPIVFLLALYLEREKVFLHRSALAKAPARCYEEPLSGDLFCVTPTVLSDKEEEMTLCELQEVLSSVEPSV